MYQPLYDFPIGTFVTFDDEDKSVYRIDHWQHEVCKSTGRHNATVVLVANDEQYFAHPLNRVKKVEVD